MKIFFKNITTKVIVLSLFLFMCVAVNNSYAQEGGITPGSPLGGGSVSSDDSTAAAFEKLKQEKAAEEARAAAEKQKKKDDRQAKRDDRKEKRSDRQAKKAEQQEVNSRGDNLEDRSNALEKKEKAYEKESNKHQKNIENAKNDKAKYEAKFKEAVAKGDVEKAERMQEKMAQADKEIQVSEASVELLNEQKDRVAAEKVKADADLAKWDSMNNDERKAALAKEKSDAASSQLQAEADAQVDADMAADEAMEDALSSVELMQASLDLGDEDEEADLGGIDDLEIVDTNVIDGDGKVSGIFSKISSKAADAVKNISQLAYILAGFGMVGFTFAAIFGKISWKYFGNIVIGLMMVSSSGMIIEYFVTPSGDASNEYRYKLSYGDYISDAVGDTLGQPRISEREKIDPIKAPGSLGTDTSKNGLAPMGNTNGTGIIPKVEKKKSLWDKIKDVGKIANDTAHAVEEGVKTYDKVTDKIDNVGALAEGMGNAIKSGDFSDVGDYADAMIENSRDALGATTNAVNEGVGLKVEVDKYKASGNYDKNAYQDHESGATAIGNELDAALGNIEDKVEDVDDVADEAHDTVKTSGEYNSYLD